MRNLNLRVALIIYGAIHIVQGFALIVAPDRVARLSNFGELVGYMPYFMAILGGTFIAAALLFIFTGLNPLRNISGVAFAILWSVLILVIQLYSLAKDYLDLSQAWPEITLAAVFAIAFLVFYPYRQR
jgi:hypothetical protein